MRKSLQGAVLRLLHVTGILNLIGGSSWRRNRLLILCYHGISLRDEHLWNGLLYIRPEHFRAHLEVLRQERANVLQLEDALNRLRSGTLPKRSVAITFDDGFYDFYQEAFPRLREFGFPSTVYLTTHYCKHEVPIFGLITDYMLWKAQGVVIEGRAFGLEGILDLRTGEGRRRAHASLTHFVAAREMSTAEQDAFARQVADVLQMDYEGFLRDRLLQIMRPEEVGQIARQGVDIQLHTHRHRTPDSRDLFLREIHDNRACIRELTGKEARHFCYPSGAYKPEFFPWLEEVGVRSATTCVRGFATAAKYLLELPRVLGDSRMGVEELRGWVCGLAR